MAFTDADRMAAAQLAIDRYHKVASAGSVRPDKIKYYTPPADWLKLGTPEPGQIKMLLSDAMSGFYSFRLLSIYYPDDSLTFTVDWGDGSAEETYSDGNFSHQYAIGTGAPCSRGYTQFVCTITAPEVDIIFGVDYNDVYGSVAYGLLGITMNASITLLSGMFYRTDGLSILTCPMLEYFQSNCDYLYAEAMDQVFYLTGVQSVFFRRLYCSLWEVPEGSMATLFSFPTTLLECEIWGFYGITSIDSMFAGLPILKKVILDNCSSIENANCAFEMCASLVYVGLYGAQMVTDYTRAFWCCASLKNVRQQYTTDIDYYTDEYDVVAGVNIYGNSSTIDRLSDMFTGCYSLESIYFFGNFVGYEPFIVSNLPALKSFVISVEYPSSMSNEFRVTDCPNLETFSVGMLPSLASTTSILKNNANLKNVNMRLSPSGTTDFSEIFSGCNSLQEYSSTDEYGSDYFGIYASLAVDLFRNCYNIHDVFFQLMGAVYQGEESGVDLTGAFVNAFKINTITLPSCPIKRIDIGNNPYRLARLSSLVFSGASLFEGASPQINISYCDITASELNALFSSLPELTGKVIDITGCSGAALCDQSIATTKGWTVII